MPALQHKFIRTSIGRRIWIHKNSFTIRCTPAAITVKDKKVYVISSDCIISIPKSWSGHCIAITHGPVILGDGSIKWITGISE